MDPTMVLQIASAGLSLFGGASQSKKAEREAEKQRKLQQEIADETNAYNEKKFKIDKENFLGQREFNFEIAMEGYERDVAIQAQQHRTLMRAYAKDQENLANQLKYNKIGAQRAYMREQNVLREIADEQAFSREQVYMQGLQNKAAARLGQGGASSDRAMMMALAEKGKNLAIMDASFSGAIRESNINMFDIALSKLGADQNARARTMLEPEAPIPLIKPKRSFLPEFIEPMKVRPGYVPQPDTTGTIFNSIAGGLNTLAGINWNNPTPAPTPVPSMSMNNTWSGINMNAWNAPNFTSNPFSPSSQTGSLPFSYGF